MSDQEPNTAEATNDVEPVMPQDKQASGPKTHGGKHVDYDKFIQKLQQFYNSSRSWGTVRL